MNFKCLNPKYRAIAELQGAFDYPAWALHAESHFTGGHPGYGWRHDHLMNLKYVIDAIQCFATRPIFYNAALYRASGYIMGGRPVTYNPVTNKIINWVPADDGNLEGDLPDGAWQAKDGQHISGPDLVHIPLSALISVAKSFGYVIKTPDGDVPAQKMALEILKYLAHAHAGMHRAPKGPLTYVGSDRGVHYDLRTLTDGLKYNFIEKIDYDTMAKHIIDDVLPKWLTVPYGSDTRVYNGLYWVLPALYDAWQLAPGATADILLPAMIAKAKCCLQLAQILPDKACTINDVKMWGPDLTVAGIVSMSDYNGPWGIRGMLCAGAILSQIDSEAGQFCHDVGMNEYSKWIGKPEGPNKVSWKCWAVDPAGNYLW